MQNCNQKLKTILIFLTIFFGILFFARGSFAATRLLYENFDDQIINSGFVIYGSNWEVLSPPQYNLSAAGRGGTGYCFSSGTVDMAYLCWEKNLPNPWPSDEMYVSFWMRYPNFTPTDSNENIKFFYPHWNGVESYIHYAMSSKDSVYYSAKGNGNMVDQSVWLNCPNQTDENWHHYEFWIKFSTAQHRFWYDGELKQDKDYQDGVWTPSTMYYISAPSIDAEEPAIFSRQVDDWEAWDGMPSSDTTPPSTPTGFSATAVSSSQINLSWSAATDNVGVTGYRIYRCQGAGCAPTTQLTTVTGTSYQNTGLSVNTTYVYRVAAYDAAGNVSGQSTSATATTQAPSDTTPPAAPSGVVVS